MLSGVFGGAVESRKRTESMFGSFSCSMLSSCASDQNTPAVQVQRLSGSFDCRRNSWVQVRCWLVIVFGVE